MALLFVSQVIEFPMEGRLERILWIDPADRGFFAIDIRDPRALPLFRPMEEVEKLEAEGIVRITADDPWLVPGAEPPMQASSWMLSNRPCTSAVPFRAAAWSTTAITAAVAVGETVGGIALAMPGAGQRRHLQLHQPLGGEADHLAQQIGIGTLFQQAAKAHHLVGHRLGPWLC